jgi:AcrR family transcriptional regulator
VEPGLRCAGGGRRFEVRSLNMKGPHRHSWHRRRGYHHGNLREALIEAARQLMEKRGPEGFSLTEAARLAGVSPAAPYRHFRDREALLAEVARSGFERFAGSLEEAWDEGRPTAIAALEKVGRAYLAFAREEPASYAAMFEAGLSMDDSPDLKAAADRAFDVLRRACSLVAETLPEAARPPGDLMSLHVWAFTHGIATLFAEGKPGRGKVPMTGEEILESGMLIYLKGLGVIPGGK